MRLVALMTRQRQQRLGKCGSIRRSCRRSSHSRAPRIRRSGAASGRYGQCGDWRGCGPPSPVDVGAFQARPCPGLPGRIVARDDIQRRRLAAAVGPIRPCTSPLRFPGRRRPSARTPPKLSTMLLRRSSLFGGASGTTWRAARGADGSRDAGRAAADFVPSTRTSLVTGSSRLRRRPHGRYSSASTPGPLRSRAAQGLRSVASGRR